MFVLHKNYFIIILSTLSTQCFNTSIGNSDYTNTGKYLNDKPRATHSKR